MSMLTTMKEQTPTRLWLDSIGREEMNYALTNGAVGCTCNPVIILNVLKSELPEWEPKIRQMIQEHPTETEDELAWRLVRMVSAERAKLLEGIFVSEKGRNGRLSVQTDPRYYRDTTRILAQAREFSVIAPNIIVKIPAVKAGIDAIEQATYEGISINATVSFTMTQAIDVAEAVERGLKRREAEGLDVSAMGPVCTLMVGRLDDYFADVAKQQSIDISPEALGWCGVAVFKEAYRIYQERGYRSRLLVAAYRNDLHMSELMGGDIVASPPYARMKAYNESGMTVADRIHTPVPIEIMNELMKKLPGFDKVYHENGQTHGELLLYPPTVKALNQFSDSCQNLAKLIRAYQHQQP